MTGYRTESHLRSLLKGVSWRLIATTDTILIVLMITCLTGHCSIESAIKIGSIEFLIKLLVYYIHERIWQRQLLDKVITSRKTLQKSITWRVLATTITFLISGSVLNAYDEIALYIAVSELLTKLVLYYFHERLWLKLPLGRIRHFFQ